MVDLESNSSAPEQIIGSEIAYCQYLHQYYNLTCLSESTVLDYYQLYDATILRTCEKYLLAASTIYPPGATGQVCVTAILDSVCGSTSCEMAHLGSIPEVMLSTNKTARADLALTARTKSEITAINTLKTENVKKKQKKKKQKTFNCGLLTRGGGTKNMEKSGNKHNLSYM